MKIQFYDAKIQILVKYSFHDAKMQFLMKTTPAASASGRRGRRRGAEAGVGAPRRRHAHLGPGPPPRGTAPTGGPSDSE